MNTSPDSQHAVADAIECQAEANERLAAAVEEQNELLRQLVDAVSYKGFRR